MQNGKTNSLDVFYASRKKRHLLFLWALLLVIIGLNIAFYFIIDNQLIQSLLLFASLIGMLSAIFVEKSKISYFDMQHRYYKMLQKSEGPVSTSCTFDANWLNDVRKMGFKLVSETDQFTIYYRLQPSVSKRTFIKTGVIEFLTIFRDANLDFYTELVEKEYKKTWMMHEKENRLNKQVVIQIKKYPLMNQVVKKELDRIIAYKEKDNYLISINCGYFEQNQTVYFLHSDEFYPNLYYKYGVDLISSIFHLTKI